MLAILLAGLAPQLVQAQSPPLALQLVSLTNLDNPGWQYRVVATGPSGTNAWLQVSHDCVRWTSETFVTLSGQLEGEAGIAATEPTTYYRLLLDDTFTANEMLRGMRRYAGARPQTMDATYASADGKSYTVHGAYAGWCKLIADPDASFDTISNALSSRGAVILDTIPAAGLFDVLVPQGSVAAFLSSLHVESWFVDGSPAGPASRGSDGPVGTEIAALDWNDLSDRDSCGKLHMSYVGDLAGARRPFDAYDRNDPQLVDVHDRTTELPAEVLARMAEALKANRRLTVNLSLQSPSSGWAYSEDRSGCTNEDCADIRRDQKQFYQGFLQMLDQTISKQPAMADNTMLVIIAGNAGVNLDHELADLKDEYPAAFNRMVVVGGTDTNGNIAAEYNHLNDNSVPNMVYARANEVALTPGCSGTSFAGPEVASVLDAIWQQATNYTSGQILRAFYQTLALASTNNVIPADAKGRVTTNFINQVVAKLATLPADIHPRSAKLPTIGGCAGGSASTTFSITAPTNVTWSISWTGLAGSIGSHTVSPSQGKGPATVTFTATVLPQHPNFTCNDTYNLTYGDQLAVEFSSGEFYFVGVSYTYLAVW